MSRITASMFVSVAAIVLGIAFTRPFMVSAQPQRTETRSTASAVKLDDGLEVEPRRVKWLAGAWQLAHDPARQYEIKEDGAGAYVMTPILSDAGEAFRLTVFKVDCYRLVQMRSTSPKQPAGVTYALLSGHAERLSLDVLPAAFPEAWRDKKLIAAVGAKDTGEVPAEKRVAALTWLADQLDDTGTLMHQDMTYFRPRHNGK